jgi:hypothetical protein
VATDDHVATCISHANRLIAAISRVRTLTAGRMPSGSQAEGGQRCSAR